VSAAASPRLLIGFDGAVECRRPAGAVNLWLRGRERGAGSLGGTVADVLFADARAQPGELAPAALPGELRDVEVFALADAGQAQIRAPGLRLDLQARSIQVHRDAARAFFAAVPPPRVPLPRRLGWNLLLLVLRLPRAERLLARLRRG